MLVGMGSEGGGGVREGEGKGEGAESLALCTGSRAFQAPPRPTSVVVS